jgi:uncharacterized protein (TIGR04255 family)
MDNVHFDRKASHSLSVVTLALVFREELNKDQLKKLQNLDQVMRDHFSHSEAKHSFSVTMNDTASQAAAPKFAGWRLDMANKDEGKIVDWQLEIDTVSCAIRTFAYSGWEDFISKAIKILTDLFERTELTQTAFDELGLQVIDRFHWNLTNGRYQLSKFFKPESAIFSESIRTKNAPLWHLFQGWKEDYDGRSYVENVNLSTNHPKEQPHRTEIAHVIRCVQGAEGEGDIFNSDVIRKLSDHAHDQNKKLLNDILSDQAIERIHLNN